MQFVDDKGYYEDYIYIGYSTEDLFKLKKCKTGLLIKYPKDKLYDQGWFPTFVKRWEWQMKTQCTYYKPKKYNLRKL